MKTVKQLLVAVLAGLVFTACNGNNEKYSGQEENPNSTPVDAYTSFAISIPNAAKTKSMTRATDPGTATENNVKTLHIFIYDAAPPHTPTLAEFSVANGTLTQKAGSTSVWVTSSAVKTTKTDKYIFAGVNLTQAIANEIKARGLGAFNYKEFAQSVSDVTDATNGFVMFNDAYPQATPADALYSSEAEAANAHMNISVDRVIAKAAVFKGLNFVVNGGGEMTDLKYGWRNINKQFYFIQKTDGGFIKDYNWDTYSSTDFTRGNDKLTVNPNGTTPTEYSYAMENAFNYALGQSVVDEATFLSIQGKFRPDQVIQIKGTIPSGTSPTGGSDFETIVNPNSGAVTFYVVRTDDGVANYFVDRNSAMEFGRLAYAGANGMPALSIPYDVDANTYTDGTCFYHVFVNSEASAPQKPYSIYRNQYYKVTVNSIQAPGNPNDNFDNGEPITPNAWIGVDIEVNAWEVVEESHDL